MKILFNRSTLALFIVLISLQLSCGKEPYAVTQADRKGAINVTVTTTLIGDLVKGVAGDLVNLETLMGPGVDPHLYKAKASDVERLRNADIIIYNGFHLEGKMVEVFEGLKRSGKTVFPLAESLSGEDLLSIKDYPSNYDPHVWLDPLLWGECALNIAEVLARCDPDNADSYKEGGDATVRDFENLHHRVISRIDEIPEDRRILVTTHDSFKYFGRRYGVEVRGLMGVSTSTEAGMRDLQELAIFVAEKKIPAVFYESTVPPRYMEALKNSVKARGFSVNVVDNLYSDSLGNPDSPEGTYIGMFYHNVETIVRGLKGRELK